MNKKDYKIEIIGAGVVGLATGKAFIKKGQQVFFIDINKDLIKNLTLSGYKAYLPNKSPNNADISIVCVSTPTNSKGIDLKYIKEASKFIGLHLKNVNTYHLVVVKSTVIPGTTEKIVIPLIEKYSSKKVGKDFGVCVNPEYLRSITAEKDALNPRAIVIGAFDQRSNETLRKVYGDFTCPIHTVSLREAEIQKYIHNTFNANKIAFFNEMRLVCQFLEIKDPERIFSLVGLSSEGMTNSSYGLKDFGPFGGACLPKDTKAFLHFIKKTHIKPYITESILEQNDYYRIR